MNNKILIVIVGILLIVVAGLTTLLVRKNSKPEIAQSIQAVPNANVPPQSLVSETGEPIVNLTPNNIRLSAIELTALSSSSKETTQEAYAEVLDVNPLMSDLTRYNQMNVEIAKAKITVQQNQQTVSRNKLLNSDDHNVSDQVLQSSESELHNAQVALSGLIKDKDNLWRTLRLNWGAQLISQDNLNQGVTSELLNNQVSLLRVTVPQQTSMHSLPQFITVNTQSGIQKLRVLGQSPRANENLLGASLFAISEKLLPIGTKLTVAYPQGSVSTGVLVPSSAVIWWQSGSWVYKEIGAGKFQRVSLEDYEEMPQGYFVKKGLVSGDKVVTQGTQLLLSKEQKDSAVTSGNKATEDDD